MCWRLVLRNRRRYKAVLAAIAFGTAGFIVIRTMGDSVEKRLGENLELLGEATVMLAEWDNHEENFHPGQYYMRDVVQLKRIPHVVAVAPVVDLPHCQASFRTTQWSPGITGVDQSYWRTQTCRVAVGRPIGASDVVGRKRVCVIGQDVVSNMFNGVDPLGQVILVGGLGFRVIGVLGGIQHTDIRRSIFVPITVAQTLSKELLFIRSIYLRTTDWNQVDWVRDQALRVLKESHAGYEDGVKLTYFPERVKKVKATIYVVKIFIYASLVVAFLLGKAGLTNIMLAAVQDRTKEIGLRKALGAKDQAVLLQFMTESVLVSFLAGIVGVIIGISAIYTLRGPLGVQVSGYIMSASIIVDLIVTAFIGVLAGLYPSRQASRLDVVSAMRFE
jgi:putative ABC transport system permease protein